MTAVCTRGEVTSSGENRFSIKHVLTLPVTPEQAYDAMTGDISGWWDHSFSGKPAKLFIEARPGGGFYEILDDSGDGVLHATVIYAQRGKLLRFEGPLGFSGKAAQFVTTYAYEADAGGCTVTVTVNASGAIEPGWDKTIDAAWHHFLFEQLKPYVESTANR